MNRFLPFHKAAGIYLLLILFSPALWAATVTASVTGNWNSTTTWGGAAVPGVNDDVIINGGITVTVKTNPTCNSLTFKGSGAVLTINTNYTLTVTNAIILVNAAAASTSASVSGGGSLYCASLTLGNSTALTGTTTTTTTMTSTLYSLEVYGNLTLNSYYQATSRISNAVFNLSSGILSVDGQILTSNQNAANTSTFTTATGAQSGSLYLSAANPIQVSAIGSSQVILTGTDATVGYTGSAPQTIYGTNYSMLGLYTDGTDYLTTGTATIGNLFLNGTANVTTVANLNIPGYLILSAGTTFTAAGYALTVGSQTSLDSGAIINISSTAGGKTFLGQITVSAGATWNNSGNSDIGVQGGITNNGTFQAGNGNYSFTNGPQTIDGSQSIHFGSLTVNSSGTLTLGADTYIAGTLNLTAGDIDAQNHNLILSAGASVSGGSASSYVITGNGVSTTGTLQRASVSAGQNLFPIGTPTYYLPVIVNPVSTQSFSAYVYKGATTNGMSNGTPIANKTGIVDAIWNLTRTAGWGSAAVTLQWVSSLEGSAFSSAGNTQIGISPYSGGSWQNSTATSADHTARTVTASFSSFNAMGVDMLYTALPLKLLGFQAALQPDQTVILSWQTSDETAFSHTNIQRSTDGIDWSVIGTISAGPEPSNNYTFTDAQPIAGVNEYRLQLVDVDGFTIYSPVAVINLSVSNNRLLVYPNPVTSNVFTIEWGHPLTKPNSFYIIDASGRILQSGLLTNPSQTVEMQPSAKGVYILRFATGETLLLKKN